MGYVSPFGKPQGLAARLAKWASDMGTDRNLPWAGLGIIEDLKLAAQLLNLREFGEWLRTHGSPEHRHFADELLRNEETLEAVDSALATAGLRNFDPVAGVETLQRERDQAGRDYRELRRVLVECGALSGDDADTPIADLVRALLS